MCLCNSTYNDIESSIITFDYAKFVLPLLSFLSDINDPYILLLRAIFEKSENVLFLYM